MTRTSDGASHPVREYRFSYDQSSFNGSSLLKRIDVAGFDDQGQTPAQGQMPPITFGYSQFQPEKRRFDPLTGRALPAQSFNNPDLALVDLFGSGLPDLLEMGATPRYWRNLGGGVFDLPQMMKESPSHSLRESGVQFIDANGDGRTDLLVTTGPLAGYFPLSFSGGWSSKSFQPYRSAPSFNLEDPNVKLIDLDGDGLTDVLRSGSRLECFFNDADPARAWQRTAFLPKSALESSPDINLSDPRIRFADMTGDGLQDLVQVQSGSLAYWPNLGHGRWGKRVQMRRAPRLPEGYDPRRILLGDVDGDGLADFIYVDHGRVLLWANRGGNGWSEQPIVITGTPGVVNTDNLQIADIYGQGTSGLLWARDADGTGRPHLMFLDFTGGLKPYLLNSIDNHLGAQTKVEYRPSTFYYLQDQRNPKTRWRTPLPIPVQVVARVEVIDEISLGKLTTEYRYHHGYWDGAEREFRGFACVEQLDTETFDDFNAPGLHGPHANFQDFRSDSRRLQFSPPTLTKTWFHVGPVGEDSGDWQELDLRHEFWTGDEQALSRPPEMTDFLGRLPRRVKRDALRALRGRMVRTELFALDGTPRQDQPYTVTESLHGIREEFTPASGDSERRHLFFAFPLAERTTQWERGDDPMTQFSFSGDYDAYGQPRKQASVAVPRGRNYRLDADAAEPYLGTLAVIEYAQRDDAGHYLVDRVARSTSYEVLNDGRSSIFKLRDAVFDGTISRRVIGHARSFYDGEAFIGLPVGELGQYGALVRSESLVFTGDFLKTTFDSTDPQSVSLKPEYLNPQGVSTWRAEYPTEFRTLLPALAGYLHYAEGEIAGSPGGYYVSGARHRYDFHDPSRVARGLVLATRDPLGTESGLAYDAHDLLPIRATDPTGLAITASYNYRAMQPREVIDTNGNISNFEFSPSGLMTAQYLRGKGQEGDGAHPSVRMEYDLRAFLDRRQPIFARSIRRCHHDAETDVAAAEREQTIVSIEYSDGFGRLMQTRTQAEDTLFGDPVFGGGVISADQSAEVGPTLARTRAASDPINVVVSGWQIYDNKGHVVEKYEPFFAQGESFASPVESQLGRKATMFYDPRGQLIRTLNPDGSEQLVVFGVPIDVADPLNYRPTPWESYIYDANDNAGRTHGAAAAAYRDHWNTPASVVVDALGRTITAVARNGANPATDWFTTRTTYDIQGNLLSITDAQGRVAFRHVYDLAKRCWRVESIDAGRHDTIPDALGNMIEGRDSKGALMLESYDLLHRPIRMWARDASGGPVTLRQMLEYGDEGSPAQSSANRTAARERNLLGRLVRQHDEAGLVTVDAVDFKGNVLSKSRRIIADAPIAAVYQQAPADRWRITPFQTDWQPRVGQRLSDREAELLEATAYQTTASYDALNRVKRMELPQDVGGKRQTLVPSYNNAGGLEKVFLNDTLYVERIAYDAKGQRALVAYGNGIMTRYAYDPQTFRLTRLRSERYSTRPGIDPAPSGPPGSGESLAPGGKTKTAKSRMPRLPSFPAGSYFPRGEALQDFGYEYDLAGNLLTIIDRGVDGGGSGGGNPTNDPALALMLAAEDALIRRFTYDPVYRLLSATGRECDLAPDGPPWADAPRCTDLTQARAYTELYAYDPMGNLLRLQHQNAAGGFVRQCTMDAASNRLRSMQLGQSTFDYAYDPSGNLRAEGSSRRFEWNHADRMKAFATQTDSAEPSVHAQYLYDAAGQRVKKLVRKQGGQLEVTHYIDGVFEHHRWGSGANAAENNHVHVMDDKQRIALVRFGAAHPDDRGPGVQFHLGDHLGNSHVVVDASGGLVNREEFTPYGETSFGSFAKKRYRFTGKERDEESGLNYHGTRYYSPWLARWVSPDTIGPRGGISLYRYSSSNPIRNVDPNGTDSKSVVSSNTNEEYVPPVGATDRKPTPETTPEVLGRQDLDETFQKNPVLRQRVESVAKELDIDPGLLGASLLAEEGPSAWSKTSGTIQSEVLGLDDWFDPSLANRLKSVINAHPALSFNFNDVKATGSTWDTSWEKPGGGVKPRGQLDATKAVAAFGVYFKMQEEMLRDVLSKVPALNTLFVHTLEDLSPEERFTVLRLTLNAGVGFGKDLFLRLAKGGDIPRSGKTTRDPNNATRTAVLHMARAIHLDQAVFGRPSHEYRPMETGRMSNGEAAVRYDLPSLGELPDRITPFHF